MARSTKAIPARPTANARPQTKLLIDEPPMQVLPKLARAIGLNEAIVLQQIHYWLNKSSHIVDGRPWIYNSLREWQEQFSFWSIATVRRTLESLRDSGLLIVGNHNQMPLDKTLWYTIDYEQVARLELDSVPSVEFSTRSVQNEQMDESATPKPRAAHLLKLSTPSAQNESTIDSERAHHPLRMSQPIPENHPREINREDDSKANAIDMENAAESAPARYSPYIAGVVIDYCRQLGDQADGAGQAMRVMRLWMHSGLQEIEVVDALHASYKAIRANQSQVGNKAAWFFTDLERRLGAHHDPTRLPTPARDKPDPPAGPAAAPGD